ncbi:MAG: cytochrome c3 family protein [Candidatus Rokubacteria bacterium]|nr:cytochrome c3 family protein [Candidatus Rokubacteria bacterium]
MTSKAGVGVLGAVLLAILLSLALSTWSRQPAAAKVAEQPISFPHNVHVQQYKLDCKYCHTEARRSEYAGLPSVTRCMGCHKITAADRPEIQKLAAYAQRGEPIPWVRIYKMPEFTYFPHKAHVRADIKCQDCHGKVEEMTTVSATTGPQLANDLLHVAGMRPGAPPLSMGWCLACHREQNRTKKDMKAPLDCVACHH